MFPLRPRGFIHSIKWRVAMKASDVMTSAVISADPDATVLQAAR
jgi:CBS domain-containing protein